VSRGGPAPSCGLSTLPSVTPDGTPASAIIAVEKMNRPGHAMRIIVVLRTPREFAPAFRD
jgi:hypothetical protein